MEKQICLVNCRYLILAVFILSLFFLTKNILYRAQFRLVRDDEVEFISRGKFLDWYILRDFNKEEWRGFESYDVPKLGEFFYGLVVRFHFKSTVINYLSSSGFYESEKLSTGSWRFEATRGGYLFITEMPPQILAKSEVILIARKYSIILFVMPLLFLIFLVGKETQGSWFGLISMIIIGSNNLFVNTMSSAIGDSLLWFFCFLFVYLSILYQKKVEKKIRI